MKKTLFGTLPSGENVHIYSLESDVATVNIMDFGATVVNFYAYGTDIAGGFDKLDTYLSDDSHQGAIIGRVANRVGGATFVMDGAHYMLPDNDHGNCLHGGCGFDRRMWCVAEYDGKKITFTYTSADGEEGFPAELSVKVTYTLDGAALYIYYEAMPTGKTPIALTNHLYFNMNGFGGTIDSHVATIYADRYTEVDDNLIPNGNRPEVCGTPFDFNNPKPIGAAFADGFEGYDHNFIIAGAPTETVFGKELPLIAKVDGDSLTLKVYSDQPGVQFYTGNFLGKGAAFKGNTPQVRHGAFCLETQTEPDCINSGIGFYEAGELYTHNTVYKVEKII